MPQRKRRRVCRGMSSRSGLACFDRGVLCLRVFIAYATTAY